MAGKEDLTKRLIVLTKRKVKLLERSLTNPTSDLYEEIDDNLKRCRAIWFEITKINAQEIAERGHY